MTNKKEIQKLFQNMIQHIQKRTSLKAIILFGSWARGTAHPKSDYDLVVIADFKEKYFARSDWILEAAPFVSIDLFCYTTQEFDSLFFSYNITAIDAIGEGLILYGEDYIKPYKEKYKDFVRRGMKKSKCILFPPQE